MINNDLKKAMADWVFEHINEYQLYNAASEHFRAYIFDANGNWLIGGEANYNFLHKLIDIIIEKETL